MNIGLPGAGIGSLFYLVCALIMPVKEVFLTVTRPEHRFRYHLIAIQLSIVAGIVSGVIAIYKLVNHVFGFNLSLPIPTDSTSIVFYFLLPVLISLGLLLIILTSVRLVSFFSSPHKSPLSARSGNP